MLAKIDHSNHAVEEWHTVGMCGRLIEPSIGKLSMSFAACDYCRTLCTSRARRQLHRRPQAGIVIVMDRICHERFTPSK